MANLNFVILKVNGKDVSNLSHNDAVQEFLTADEPIIVEVKRRVSSISSPVIATPLQSEPASCVEETKKFVSIGVQTSDDDDMLFTTDFDNLSLIDDSEEDEEEDDNDERIIVIDEEENYDDDGIVVGNDMNQLLDFFQKNRVGDSSENYDEVVEELLPQIEVITLRRSTSTEKLGLTISYNIPSSSSSSSAMTTTLTATTTTDTIGSRTSNSMNDKTLITPSTPSLDRMQGTASTTISSSSSSSISSNHQSNYYEVFISDIEVDSLAARDGRLRQGDQILQINGHDVMNKEETDSLLSTSSRRNSKSKDITLLVQHCNSSNGPSLNATPTRTSTGKTTPKILNKKDDPNRTLTRESAQNEYVNEIMNNAIKYQEKEQSRARLQQHQQSQQRYQQQQQQIYREPIDNQVNDKSQSKPRSTKVKQSLTIIDTDTEHIYETIPDDDYVVGDNSDNMSAAYLEPLYCQPYAAAETLKMETNRSPKTTLVDGKVRGRTNQKSLIDWYRMQQVNKIDKPKIPQEYHTTNNKNLLNNLKQVKQQLHAQHLQQQKYSTVAPNMFKANTLYCCGNCNSQLMIYNENKKKKKDKDYLYCPNCGVLNNDLLQQPMVDDQHNPTDLTFQFRLNDNNQQQQQFKSSTLVLCPRREQKVAPLTDNIMYTNNDNLQQTIMLQQQLFRQSLSQQQQQQLTKKTEVFNAPNLAKYHFVSGAEGAGLEPNDTGIKTKAELDDKHPKMVWKVKKRPDGTRYIVRRPIEGASKEQKDKRAIQTLRQNAMTPTTTEDETFSEIKLGRYWPKDERKKHLEKSRERQQQRYIQQLIRQQQLQDIGQKEKKLLTGTLPDAGTSGKEENIVPSNVPDNVMLTGIGPVTTAMKTNSNSSNKIKDLLSVTTV